MKRWAMLLALTGALLLAAPVFAQQGIRQYNTFYGNQNPTLWTPPGGTAPTPRILTSDPTNKYWIAADASTLLSGSLDADLTAFAALDATAGYLVKTGANAYARRTFTSTGSTITITNPAGTAGATNLDVNAITQSQVTDLVTDLAGKAASVHTHAQADVTNLTTDLSNKQPLDAQLTTLSSLGSPLQQIRVNAGGTDLEYFTPSVGAGTVTDFSATPSGIFDVATSTTTPALSLDNQNANLVLAGPSTGAAATPAFRALVAADIPAAFVDTPDTPTLGNQLVFDGTDWKAYPNVVIPTIYTPELRARRSIVLGATNATTYTALGISSALTLPGTETSVSDATGNYISCASAALLNSDTGVSSAITVTQTQLKPRAFFHIKTGASLATLRIFVGLTSNVATQIAADLPATHFAGFRYSPAADGTAFWRTLTNDAGVGGTVNATTTAIAVNTAYTLCVDATDPASIKFLINGVLVNTHATDLPTTSQALGIIAYARTLELVAKTILTGAIQVEGIQ